VKLVKENFLFCILILFLLQIITYGQLSTKNGVPYTTEITVKFKTKAFDEIDIDGFAKLQDFRTGFKSAKDFFLKYGAVQFKKTFVDANWCDTVKYDLQGKAVRVPDLSQIYYIIFPEPVKMWETVYALRKLPSVEFADPPAFVVNEVTPDDLNGEGNQWNLSKVDATTAWDVTTGSSSVIVAVIDEGVDASHEDLSAKLTGGESSYAGGTANHGTRVAGVVGAATDNGTGIASLGWNIMIRPYNHRNTSGSAQDITSAVNSGAHILNCSWRTVAVDPNDNTKYINYDDGSVRNAIVYAVNQGRIVVASAGNPPAAITFSDGITRNPSEYPPYPIYPASNNGVIGVSATNSSDQFPTGYNYGSHVDVGSPSVNIITTGVDDNYPAVSGTSFGAPLVAALAGLSWSINPDLTTTELTNQIFTSAEDLGAANWDQYYGYGRINAEKAVHYLYVPQAFSTIQSALDVVSSGQIIQITGTQTLVNDNITIPSGVTLKINTGATLNLGNFAILLDGGVIDNQGTINGLKAYLKSGSTLKGLFPSIQSAINVASFSQTVELLNTTYNESISITSKPAIKLYGAANYGSIINGNITITNSSYALLNGLKMHDYHSITVNGGTSTNLSNIKYMASSTLVYVYNGYNTIIGGIQDGGTTTSEGINCNNTSASIRGVNITDYDFAIWAQSNSTLNVSMYSNFCNNLLDEVALSGCTIQNNEVGEWSSQWPNNVYGNVTGGDPTDDYCTQKLSKTGLLASLPKVEPLPSGLLDLNNDYLQLLGRISLENRDNPNFSIQEYKPAFLDLISRYKPLLRKDSNNKTVNAVLSKLAHCYYIIGEKDLLKTYLDNLTTSPFASQFLPYIKRHYINFYVEEGDFESAITIADEVYNSSVVDDDVKCEMLYEKGVIYKYYLNEIDNSTAAFAQIFAKYPNNNLYSFAKTELETENVFIAKKTDSNNNEEVSKYETAVYPNPFNPSTKIAYSIPERGNVILKVYDILGREIVQLVNEVKESGNYQVTFDGGNLNSGVYFYTIESGKYRESKKLLLVK
jgi:hypothetical protein